ncbi:S-adenosyl-L-methionine dependent methyltransferase, partial [Fistulina hepatica ATCC 64428]
MHPRNPYASPLDFSQLAESYPALKPCLIPTSHGDFTISYRDARSQMLLTQALLNRDFGLSVRLLEDRLCPPIPNRLNYVLWIQDIVEASSLSDQVSQRGREIRGIDIGTGACAIYPLLACSLEQSWKFCATEIDQHSLDNAKAVVADNGLVSRIEILQAKEDGPLLLPLKLYNFDFDFSMCNPPFYSSREEMATSARVKESRPNAACFFFRSAFTSETDVAMQVCTGAEVEMITPGGEAVFVNRMIEESRALRTRCQWYTSMLGKMASLFAVCEALRAHSIDNYAITEFVQGQTRRWAVAWSFGDARLPDSMARISNPDLRSLMPPRNNLQQPF